MTFYEQELKKLFGNSDVIRDAKYSGKTLLGRIDDELRVKLQFVYDALYLSAEPQGRGEHVALEPAGFRNYGRCRPALHPLLSHIPPRLMAAVIRRGGNPFYRDKKASRVRIHLSKTRIHLLRTP